MEDKSRRNTVTLFSKQHGYEYPPAKLLEVLSQQHAQNSLIKKQIALEKQVSSKLSQCLSQHLNKLEDQAVKLASRLQLQAKKNQQLEELVQRTQSFIYGVKKRNSDLIRANLQNTDDILPSLLRKQRKLEYDIEQLIQKHNQSLCAINQAIETVNAARSQRVIYSGIFNNIEKQLFESQIVLKKLMIQRESCQILLQRQRSSFQKVVREAQKKQNLQIMMLQCNDAIGENLRAQRYVKTTSYSNDRAKQKVTTERGQTLTLPEQTSYRQNLVKSIFTQTESKSVEDIENRLNTIYGQNDELLKESIQIDQQITKTEKRISAVRKKRTLKLLSSSNKALTHNYYLTQQNQRSKQLLCQNIDKLNLQLVDYLKELEPIRAFFNIQATTDPKKAGQLTSRLELQLLRLLQAQPAKKQRVPPLVISTKLNNLIHQCAGINQNCKLYSRRQLQSQAILQLNSQKQRLNKKQQ